MATATEDEVTMASDDESPDDAAAIAAANEKGDEEYEAGADGRTLEELAEDEQPTPPMQLALPGTIEKIPGRMGGMKPTESTIRIMGARVPVAGVFEKGEVLELRVKIKIGEVGEVDSHDAFGTVEKTVRAHKARLIEVVRVDAP